MTPLFIPILILINLFLIVISKENRFYQKSRIIIFSSGISIIIISEIMLKFVNDNFLFNIKIILVPIVIFTILYALFRMLININIGAKN